MSLRTQIWDGCSVDEKVARKVIKLHGKGFVEFDLAEVGVSDTDYQKTVTLDAEVEEELTGKGFYIIWKQAFFVMLVNAH